MLLEYFKLTDINLHTSSYVPQKVFSLSKMTTTVHKQLKNHNAINL